MKNKFIISMLLMVACCAFHADAAKVVRIPISSQKGSYNKIPRVPALNPLPVCFYSDGMLTINFPSPEGEAEVVITHSDYTEEYTVTTETVILLNTGIAVGDTVEITTEEGNSYIAVYEEE